MSGCHSVKHQPRVAGCWLAGWLPACLHMLSGGLGVMQVRLPRSSPWAGPPPSVFPDMIMLCVAAPNLSQSCWWRQHIHDMLRSAIWSAAVRFALTLGQGVLGPKASAAGSDCVELASSWQVPPPLTSGPTARKPLHSGAALQAAAHARATCPLVRGVVAPGAGTRTFRSSEPIGL